MCTVPTMSTGPEVMRAYRQERKWSQDQLARLVTISVSAISQIERGVNHPRRDTAERIDTELGADGEILRAFGFDPLDAGYNIIPGDVLLGRFTRLETKVDQWAAHAEDRGNDIETIRADCEAVRDDVSALMAMATTITALSKELAAQSVRTLDVLAEIQQAVG